MYNVTRRVRETIITVEEQEVLHVCLCVCARVFVWVPRHVGVCTCVKACSLVYLA